jgi:ribonuclease-3
MAFSYRALSPLEKKLRHRFRRPDLLALALTHRSWANEQGIPEHYERLEFLGDAVLGLVAAEWLYERHPELPEGELSKLKSQLVSRNTLAAFAEELELGPALRMGVGEERSGGRTKASLLADSVEAVFAALYLDGGLDAASKAVVAMLEGAIGERSQLLDRDAKTQLQEVAQALAWPLPEYRILETSGPDHNKVFTVECWLAGEPSGQGEGPSKKLAEQRAAADALARLAANGTIPPP